MEINTIFYFYQPFFKSNVFPWHACIVEVIFVCLVTGILVSLKKCKLLMYAVSGEAFHIILQQFRAWDKLFQVKLKLLTDMKTNVYIFLHEIRNWYFWGECDCCHEFYPCPSKCFERNEYLLKLWWQTYPKVYATFVT